MPLGFRDESKHSQTLIIHIDALTIPRTNQSTQVMSQRLLKHILMHIKSRDKFMHSSDISNTKQWTQDPRINTQSQINNAFKIINS